MTSFVQNNEDTYINNISWKAISGQDIQIIQSKAPVNARPFINTAASPGLNAPLRTGQGRLVTNPFRANPIKHYRKQYSNVTPLALGGAGGEGKSIDRALLPGGLQTATIENGVKNTSSCAPDGGCAFEDDTPDAAVAYRSAADAINKVGDHYPRAAFAGDETYAGAGGYANNNPCNNLPGNYKQCVAVCDPAKAARARVRYPSTVNTNKLKPKYYQSNSAYLRARARTFNQKAMTHVDQAANTCVPRDTKPGAVTANCLEFYPNAVETCAATPDCGGCRQVSTFYKPSNSTFAHQGAVASGTRVERLKHDTIQKFANSFVKDSATNIGLSGAYSFRGAGAAPYTMKSKTNRCEPATYRRNGNPVVCRPFPPAKKFFNQHNNPAY